MEESPSSPPMSTPRKRTSSRAHLNSSTSRPVSRNGERSGASSPNQNPHDTKRRRVRNRIIDPDDFNDLFELPESIEPRPVSLSIQDLEEVTKEEEVKAEQRKIEEEKEKRKNWLKLANFQCAICMDNCDMIVVTHCGHMFCKACLNQSLAQAGRTPQCPICRQSVLAKDAKNYTAKSKGFFQLRIKIRPKARGNASPADKSTSGSETPQPNNAQSRRSVPPDAHVIALDD